MNLGARDVAYWMDIDVFHIDVPEARGLASWDPEPARCSTPLTLLDNT